MKCPICEESISRENKKCPRCGHALFTDQIILGRVSQIDNEIFEKNREEWQKKDQKQKKIELNQKGYFDSDFRLSVYSRIKGLGRRYFWTDILGDTPGKVEIPKDHEIILGIKENSEINSIHKFLNLIRDIKNNNRVAGLDLSVRNISDSYLEELSRIKQLTCLNLSHIYYDPIMEFGFDYFTDMGLLHVGKLTNLDMLNLSDNKQITDEGLQNLKDLKKLIVLELRDCNQITDVGLVAISSFNKLAILDISYCNEITDYGLATIKYLSELKELGISGCEKITDEGLAYLCKLDKLERLRLARCNRITDQGLISLSKLKNLQRVFLPSKKITNRGLIHLANAPALHNIQFSSNIWITRRGVYEALKKNPKLEIKIHKRSHSYDAYRMVSGEIKVDKYRN